VGTCSSESAEKKLTRGSLLGEKEEKQKRTRKKKYGVELDFLWAE